MVSARLYPCRTDARPLLPALPLVRQRRGTDRRVPPDAAQWTPDGLLVKRLRKRKGRWWADSDNDVYEPRPISRSDRALVRRGGV